MMHKESTAHDVVVLSRPIVPRTCHAHESLGWTLHTPRRNLVEICVVLVAEEGKTGEIVNLDLLREETIHRMMLIQVLTRTGVRVSYRDGDKDFLNEQHSQIQQRYHQKMVKSLQVEPTIAVF